MFFRLQKFAKPFSSFLGGVNTNRCFSSTSYSGPSPSESVFTMIQNHQSFSSVPPEHNRLIGFDKLTETCSSETYRGFDRTLQKFVSIKNIDLDDSSESLEQLKTILVQIQTSAQPTGFSPCQGIFLDKSAQKMTVISDCNYQLLSDYSQFKLENNISWRTDELLSLSLQLLHKISALEQLGGFLAAPSIQPQNIFLTSKSGLLKFHSLSDFHFPGETTKVNSPDPLSKIIGSLVKITNPIFSGAGSQGYSYLEKKYPEFLESFKSLSPKEKAHYFSKGQEFINGGEFDQHVRNKLEKIIESKNNPAWENDVISFFSQDSQISSESSATASLEASLGAFKNALLSGDKLPKALIQQVEQEYKKVYELLELIDPKVLKNYDDIRKSQKKSKIPLILMSLGEDFFMSLNLGGVIKGTFIFALYFFLMGMVLGTFMVAFEYLFPPTPHFGSDFEATQNQQETNKTS